MRVAVLGCGPAGLLAAHGATLAGAEVDIYSIKKPSFIAGAQFMHRAIPQTGVKGSQVQLFKRGTKEGYAKKVYGDPTYSSSWEAYAQDTLPCWPMNQVYTRLWERYEDRIKDCKVDDDVLDNLEYDGYSLLLSTIPAPTLCSKDHIFVGSTHRIAVYDRTGINQNYIIYNGLNTDEWHRSSVLHGTGFLEYGPSAAAPNIAKPVVKPQTNDCDCRSDWQRLGRYGKWQRGVLAHHAYEEAFIVVQSL